MFVPPLRHWKVIGPVPVAATVKEAPLPTQAEAAEGWVVIEGAVLTVSVAAEVVVLPQALVTTQSKEPASPAATAAIE